MDELDRITVANYARIPCTIRTLKPFFSAGMKPFVHMGEISDALLYLAVRANMPDVEVRALKELLESLSSSISNVSVSPAHHPVDEENTVEQQIPISPAGNY